MRMLGDQELLASPRSAARGYGAARTWKELPERHTDPPENIRLRVKET
jgi:hypothetical protein